MKEADPLPMPFETNRRRRCSLLGPAQSKRNPEDASLIRSPRNSHKGPLETEERRLHHEALPCGDVANDHLVSMPEDARTRRLPLT